MTGNGNGGGAPDKALLVVSFGTSHGGTRERTIGAIERALQEAYPAYVVRRAFTSRMVAAVMRERDGVEVDDVCGALERLAAGGFREVVVQPTHVMGGYEYDKLVAQATACKDRFRRFAIGRPLLASDGDYGKVIEAVAHETKGYGDDTAVVLMGHGTGHGANAVYAQLQRRLAGAGFGKTFVGTVEAEPGLDSVLALVEAAGVDKVALLPLMVVAGDHAVNDMAGDGPDSWKSRFAAAGYEVACVLRGLGEYAGIRRLYIEHVAEVAGQ